jgi:ankyrin repeat protein
MRLPMHQRWILTDAPFLASAWPAALRILGDNEGRLPLHHAVQAGVFVHVRVLASAWPDALRTGDNEGRLPLHVAARHNEGHRPPFRNDRERIEAQREMIDLVQFVASEWRNALQVRDSGGRLPLHHAARHGSLVVVKCITSEYPLALLVPQGLGWYPLHLAAERDDEDLDVVQFLAAKWPRALREKTEDGWLPLHVAAKGSSVAVVHCLSQRRPQALFAATPEGWLPLHVAARHATADVVRALSRADPAALRERDALGRLPPCTWRFSSSGGRRRGSSQQTDRTRFAWGTARAFSRSTAPPPRAATRRRSWSGTSPTRGPPS